MTGASIDRLGGGEDAIADVRAQAFERDQVRPAPTQQLAELALDRAEADEARDVLRVELDQHVDVARSSEIVAQHRSEQREAADVMPRAEIAERAAVNVELNGHRLARCSARRDAGRRPGV